jgi:dipeptidyl aminopeptidase/acylaminoacyl peptidase
VGRTLDMIRRSPAPAIVAAAVATGVVTPAALQSVPSSPKDRTLTDPASIVSSRNEAARPVPIDDLYFTRNVFTPSWSPDGEQIAFTSDIAGRLNLWKVSASGGWPVQLTQSDEMQTNAVWSPDGKWIVFQQDRGGNELYDVYAVPSAGGAVVNLTNTPEIREESPRWSHDGTKLAFNYKPKTATVYDVAVLDWTARTVRNLTNERTRDHLWSVVALSQDGKSIYANRVEVSFTDSDVYRVDVAAGEAENLTPHDGKVLFTATSLAPDGKSLLVTSTLKGGYQNIAELDLVTKKLAWVTDTEWEAASGDYSPDGKLLSYVLNEDGRTHAFLVERASRRPEELEVPPGLNTLPGSPAFSPKGDRVIVSHQSSTQPADFWVYDVVSRRARQLTVSAIASLNAAPLPASQIVHFKTFDGRVISALLWVPFNLKRDGRNPALVIPHGGPTGQMVDYWNTDVTALVSRGYICIAPNVRGSTGYGMEFQKANYQDLGGGDLQDEVFATKFLIATGYVAASRAVPTAGS